MASTITDKLFSFFGLVFRRAESADIQVFLDKVERRAEVARAGFEKRWNFSLVEDKPFEGHIQWESVKDGKRSRPPRKGAER